MKRTKKILGIIAMICAMVGTLVTTASAATWGSQYSVGGIGLGWILIGLAALVAILTWAKVLGKALVKPLVPVIAIMFIAGIAMEFVDVTPQADTASATPPVTWSVTTAVDSATNQTTTDDDARTITILCKVNSTSDTMNNTWDEVGQVGSKSGFVNPVINFTIEPSQTEGIISTDLAVAGVAVVNNPDQEFTEDSTTYDLFADASSENKKDVNWTGSGTASDYESKYYTVNFGSEDYAILTIVFLDDGICELEAGESESFTITVCGITYTATIIVTEVLT